MIRPELDRAVALAPEIRASGVAVTIVVRTSTTGSAAAWSWPRRPSS